MKKWLLYGGLFILSYGFFLVINTPASIIISQLEDPMQAAQIRLQGVSGTAWDGRVSRVNFKGKSLGSVQWQASPWGMLLGGLSADLYLNDGDDFLQGTIRASMGGDIAVDEMSGELAAARIAPYIPYRVPGALEGRLRINMQTVEISDLLVREAQGRLVWSGAAVKLGQAIPLGDLAADINTGEDGSIQVAVKDAGGPLKIDGTVSLAPDQSLNVNAKLAAGEDAAPLLKTGLGVLGKPDKDGWSNFTFSGRLVQ